MVRTCYFLLTQGLAVEWLTTCLDGSLPDGLGESGYVNEANGCWVMCLSCSHVFLQHATPSLICGRLQTCAS